MGPLDTTDKPDGKFLEERKQIKHRGKIVC